MEIVNLVGGDRRSPKQGQSDVAEGAVLGRAGCPVFPLHQAIVGGRSTERNSIALVIGSRAAEGTASRHSSLEMVNVRGLEIGPGRLIVASVLIQPRNRVGIGAAVRRARRSARLLTGTLR